ncbi:MAG: tetratricopeptide repeat protein [Acidobacteriota bacterium]
MDYKRENTERLDSWKEISLYLDRSEKTCRNWATSLGLPIHRIGKSPKARVFAYKNELDTWLKEIDDSKIAEKGGNKFSIPVKAITILSLTIIIVISVLLIIKRKPALVISPVDPGTRPTLAVVDFENKSGDKELDNWRDAFSELLTIDLSQSRYIKVLRSDEVYCIKKKLGILESRKYSSDDLKAIAKKGGASYILKVSYFEAGESFMITAILINMASEETISSLSVKAETEKDIFSRVDHLTKEIKSKLKLSDLQISGDLDHKIEQITTSSLEALNYYKKGLMHLHAGKFRKSINLMEKAIVLDKEFALAYISIAYSYGVIGYSKRRDDYLKKAYKFSHRLPEREKAITRGKLYSNSEKTIPEAIKIFKKMLQFNPEDKIAIEALSKIYENMEDFDNAVEFGKKRIETNPSILFPYYGMACIYQKMGRYDKAWEVLKSCIKNVGEHNFIRIGLAEVLMFQGKLDQALLEIEKAIALAPDSWPIYIREGDIYLYKGDFINAKKAYRKLLKFKEKSVQSSSLIFNAIIYSAQGRLIETEKILRNIFPYTEKNKLFLKKRLLHEYLIYIYFINDEYKKCLKEIDEIISIAEKMKKPVWEKMGRFYRAMVFLKTGPESEALKSESELTSWVRNRANKNLIRWLYLFRGIKEKRNGNLSKAIKFFNKAISLLLSESVFDIEQISIFFNRIAHAYQESGKIDKAKEMFHKVTSLTHGRFFCSDIYAKSFYQLGKIYQEQNKKDKAVKNYTKFIKLWKNCDPQFRPMVEDAGNRVKELQNI